MLKLHPVYGNPFAIETETAFLPFYQLNTREIILLDTGRATDREALEECLSAYDFQVKGIICSHAHMDHGGNVQYFRDIYDCRVAAHVIEANIASTVGTFLTHYRISTPDGKGGVEECFATSDYLTSATRQVIFCGVEFQILQLPGHSGGHIGIVTPDYVAYLGDALMGFPELAASKMPTTQYVRQDLESKRSLHKLQANAYVVAHKAILQDIHLLVDANINCYEGKARAILRSLRDGSTIDKWLQVYCEDQRLTVRTEDSFTILKYGFNNMVTYLKETAEVISQSTDNNLCYYRNIGQYTSLHSGIVL